jgi:hypothetical protein
VYVDGIELSAQSASSIAAQRPIAAQRFWSSEPRAYGDATVEMMVVQLSSSQLLNYIALSLPHFPAQYQIAWRDPAGAWAWAAGPSGMPLQFTISGSVPSVVDSAAALSAGLNPYHYGSGHWIPYEEVIMPVTATALMITGSRISAPGAAATGLPSDSTGQAIPYPLGVMNLDFGYQALSRADVPYASRSAAVITERESFASTEDINGSPVALSQRENRASDLLIGLPWKCAPQPSSSAAVNLYADARASGFPQVIDRFSVNPTTSGITLNLYYTSDPPAAGSGFQAVDTPLSFPYVIASGPFPPSISGGGLLMSSGGGWCDVLNAGTGIDFTSPWWMAMEIQPLFDSADPGSYFIVDCGMIQIWYSSGFWTAASGGGESIIALWPAAHNVNDRLQFAAGWDGRALTVWFSGGSAVSVPAAASSPSPLRLTRFGATQQDDSRSAWGGNYRLTSWILKQEAPVPAAEGVPGQWLSYAAGPPQDYSAPIAGPGPTTVNACGRFDASFVNATLAPQGFTGGMGSAWSSCSWTPIIADYKLTAGYLQFRPVLAAGFRFEFTGLLPETYQFYNSIVQSGQYYPPDEHGSHPPVPVLPPATVSPGTAALSGANRSPWVIAPPGNADPGLAVGASITPPSYSDSAPARNPPAPGAAGPTEAIYGTDPQAAESMAARGSALNFQPWQAPAQGTGRQVVGGGQSYQVVETRQSSSVAYFAGLSSLSMYRANYTAANDVGEYIDTFADTAWISEGSLQQPESGGTVVPWDWSPGLLAVPDQLPPGGCAQISSQIFTSAHQVTGVQFATVQSAQAQIMPDPSFMEPGIPYLSAVGDALPPIVSAAGATPFGSAVMVQRQPGQQSWAAVAASYPLWEDFAGTWAQLGGTPETNPYGGVAYIGEPIKVSGAGRLTIAARVFSDQALQGPLLLQLLDGSTGIVIAEEPQAVAAGVVTEWSAQATVGEGTAGTYTWSQMQTIDRSWSSFAGVSWNQADTSQAGLGSTITWQIIEQGLFADSWGVGDVSVFEDSILWEFSNDGGASWYPAYDINANPAGALVFPSSGAGGGQLSWRLTGYRPGTTVASLAIRPWYSIYPRGVPPRVQGVPHGPNVSGLDWYGPITSDPYWQGWSGPVPQYWYWAYRQLLLAGTSYTAPVLAPPPVPPAPPVPPPPVSDIFPGRGIIGSSTPL